MITILGLAAAVVVLAGCATPLGMFGGADELAALAKVKDANVVCIEADVMLGANKGSLVIASVDKGISAQIVVDARGKCAVGIRTEK